MMEIVSFKQATATIQVIDYLKNIYTLWLFSDVY